VTSLTVLTAVLQMLANLLNTKCNAALYKESVRTAL